MTERFERDIDRLFSEELLPLGACLKSRKVILLETELEKGASSYFVRRANAEMTKIDFETGFCASRDTIKPDLTRLWNRANEASLATLAPEIAHLACILRQVHEESGDISNIIYVMY